MDLQDFNWLAASFGSTNRQWSDGDFDFDGIVGLSDFNRLASTFGLSARPGGPTAADWAALVGAVPEPVTVSLAVNVGVLLLSRHRRGDCAGGRKRP